MVFFRIILQLISENYLRADGEKRQLPSPVFNSRYALDLLHKLVDDILFVFIFFFSKIYLD